MNSYHNNTRPPYLLGLLGFIPLVGAFVGLGLMFYGIFEYKSKALTGIGLAGILFTVFVYSSLASFSNSDDVKRMLVPHTRDQLSSLVKNIEFYKMQHGNYPDSLQQLEKDDLMVSIYDPIQSLNKSEFPAFRYKCTPKGYYLSSIGLDGEADTPDDLFPLVPQLKGSKVGLLKEEL
jgi:hypothetical protein